LGFHALLLGPWNPVVTPSTFKVSLDSTVGARGNSWWPACLLAVSPKHSRSSPLAGKVRKSALQ